ncbi:MAG: PAS domain S-box protein [Sphaerochaetaceae bacterium]|nr:PAS domain S-box protein [Sphaerochaetaceae bacterium]
MKLNTKFYILLIALSCIMLGSLAIIPASPMTGRVFSLLLIVFLLTQTVVRTRFHPLSSLLSALEAMDEDFLIKRGKNRHDETGNLAGNWYRAIDRQSDTAGENRDLHDRLDAEKRRYQTVMDLATDAIFIIRTTDGKLLEYNRRAKTLLGYEDEEMSNLFIMDWDRHIQDLSTYKDIISEINEDTVELVREHTRKDGSTYTASVMTARITVDDEQIIYASVRDITQIQANERELVQKNEILEYAQRITQLGYWVRDAETDTLRVSEEMYRILGINREQFDSRLESITACIHPDDRDRVMEVYAAARENRTGHVPRYRMCRANGEIAQVHSYMTSLTDEQGKVVGTLATVQDITEHVAYEEQLKTITETSLDAIITMDEKGLICFWNPAAERIFGYTEKEVLGRNLHTLLAPERYHAEFRTAFQQFRKTGTGNAIGRTIELYGLHKNGHEFVISLSLSAIQQHDTWQAVAIVRDITEQKAQEKALKDSEFRWKFAIEFGQEGLWDWDIRSSTVFFSPRWKEMLGFAENEIQDSLEEWEKRVHPEDMPRVQEDLKQYFEGNTEQYINEHRVLCRDGSYKWILDRGVAVERDADGTPLRVIGTHMDITEKKEEEDRIRVEHQKLITIFNSAVVGIALLNLDLQYTYTNHQYRKILGIPAEDFSAEPFTAHTQSEFATPHTSVFNRVRETGNTELIEQDIITGNDVKKRLLCSVALFPDNKQFILTVEDNTKQHEMMKILEQQALTDVLTKLGNRQAFNIKTEECFAQHRRNGISFSLFVFDIDHFKSVNDTYGHITGDEVLVSLSAVATSNKRATDFIYRIGGEEFAVYLTGTDLEGATHAAEQLRRRVMEEVTVKNGDHITISIGVAELRNDDTPDSLFKRADDNLYLAKRTGRNRVEAS